MRAEIAEADESGKRLGNERMDICGMATTASAAPANLERLLGSYRRLADIFRQLLTREALADLLDEIAAALGDLVSYDALTIYGLGESADVLAPMLVRDRWAEEILQTRVSLGRGITGWAALHREPVWTNQAQLDPRVQTVPGTPADEPEALICVPLVDRGRLLGALNLYRLGEQAAFSEEEFELACRFGDAAALALAQAEMRTRLEEEARTDALTGIGNRRAFCERLDDELERARRSREAVGLLMLDIDDFKPINDRAGHGVGDQVLIALARALESAVRHNDFVARLGGEEFALLLPQATPKLVTEIGERIRARIAMIAVEQAGTVTVSLGGATATGEMNAKELVEAADQALMAVKRGGKNGLRLALR
jgi:diguanylate cyclase (GGDEF)-like protein